MKIVKDMMIIDVLRLNPIASHIFQKYNMTCTSCFNISFETLEKGGIMHGIDVNILLNELNKNMV